MHRRNFARRFAGRRRWTRPPTRGSSTPVSALCHATSEPHPAARATTLPQVPVGAPPRALDGQPATLRGVPIAVGLHHPARPFTTRATLEELWAPLDIAASPQGRKALWESSTVKGAGADARTYDRFSAYLTQARSFF